MQGIALPIRVLLYGGRRGSHQLSQDVKISGKEIERDHRGSRVLSVLRITATNTFSIGA